KLAGIDWIERMLGVDEGADAAAFLGFGDDVERQRGLARALRPERLDDAAAGQSADSQRDVEAERARRNGLDRNDGVLAEAHHGTLAEVPLDLAQRGCESLVLVHYSPVDDTQRCGSTHMVVLLISCTPGPRNASGWDVNVHRMCLVCSHFVSEVSM